MQITNKYKRNSTRLIVIVSIKYDMTNIRKTDIITYRRKITKATA